MTSPLNQKVELFRRVAQLNVVSVSILDTPPHARRAKKVRRCREKADITGGEKQTLMPKFKAIGAISKTIVLTNRLNFACSTISPSFSLSLSLTSCLLVSLSPPCYWSYLNSRISRSSPSRNLLPPSRCSESFL